LKSTSLGLYSRSKIRTAALAPGGGRSRTLGEHLKKAHAADRRHPEGPPFEHYGEIQSGEALRYAGEILAFVCAQMA